MAGEEITIQVNDILISILSGLIVTAIIGAATSMFVLYKCIHKQALKLDSMRKGVAVVLKLLVHDTKINHPNSKHITEIDKIYKEIDKIYKEIVEDSD